MVKFNPAAFYFKKGRVTNILCAAVRSKNIVSK